MRRPALECRHLKQREPSEPHLVEARKAVVRVLSIVAARLTPLALRVVGRRVVGEFCKKRFYVFCRRPRGERKWAVVPHENLIVIGVHMRGVWPLAIGYSLVRSLTHLVWIGLIPLEELARILERQLAELVRDPTALVLIIRYVEPAVEACAVRLVVVQTVDVAALLVFPWGERRERKGGGEEEGSRSGAEAEGKRGGSGEAAES